MEFNCNQNILDEHLSYANNVCGTKNINPIHNNIFIEANKNKQIVILKSTNPEIYFESHFPAQVEENGNLLFSCSKIFQITRSLKGCLEIEIKQKNENTVELKSPNNSFTNFKLNMTSSNDFPMFPNLEKSNNNSAFLTFNSLKFKKALSKIKHAIGKDDVGKFYFMGVFLKKIGNKIELLTTDGKRLAKSSFENEHNDETSRNNNEFEKTLILPSKFVERLPEILDCSEFFNIVLTEQGIFLEAQHIRLIGCLISGEQPNFSSVINRKFSQNIVLEAKFLCDSIRRVSTLSDDDLFQISLVVSNEGLLLKSNHNEFGSVQSKIEFVKSSLSVENIEISMNYKFLLDAIKEIEKHDGVVKIEFEDEESPIKIKDPKQPDYFSVIMPMKI